MRGLGGVYQRGKIWWIYYNYRGKLHRESSHSTNRADAVRLLKRRVSEVGRGRLTGPSIERTRFEDLADMLVADYQINRRRSLDRIQRAIAHLRAAFYGVPALDITPDRVSRYIADRQADGAANATINRELSALIRMFRLGEKAGKVDKLLRIEKLTEDNVREGFFDAAEFHTLLSHFSEDLRPLIQVAYITGWRVKSELLTRRWTHVNFADGTLRLEAGAAKNKEGRTFTFTPELREILERQRARTEALQTETGQIIPWIFHRRGKPIKDFRRSWQAACEKAGLIGRIPHDFRRTAVRNLTRAGVDHSTQMKLVGHKTESIYRRYLIVDDVMLREAADKLSAFHQQEARRSQSVSTVQGKVHRTVSLSGEGRKARQRRRSQLS